MSFWNAFFFVLQCFFSGPEPATGAGQYHVVVRGTVIHDATELETLSCGFVEAADPAPVYRAGVDGAALMICQFPRLEDMPV